MKTLHVGRREFLASARNALIAATLARYAIAQPAVETSRREDLRVVSSDEARVLLRVSRRVMPLDGLSNAAYWTIVHALDTSAAGQPDVRRTLVDGASSLRRHLGEGWPSMSDEELDTYLASPRAAPLLDAVRSVGVPVFVGLPEVWAAVGYDGESLSKGGYLHRGFNDLTWLPEPSSDAAGPVP